MLKETAILINGSEFSGIIKNVIDTNDVKIENFPVFFVQDIKNKFPQGYHYYEYVDENMKIGDGYINYLHSSEDRKPVLREGKIFNLFEIKTLIEELTDVKEQMEAMIVIDKLVE